MNYFGVEFLKISFYLILFVKMEFFRQKERIQVIKYIYLFKKKKKWRRRWRLRLGHISCICNAHAQLLMTCNL